MFNFFVVARTKVFKSFLKDWQDFFVSAGAIPASHDLDTSDIQDHDPYSTKAP